MSLWVRSGHQALEPRCLLYPKSRYLGRQIRLRLNGTGDACSARSAYRYGTLIEIVGDAFRAAVNAPIKC